MCGRFTLASTPDEVARQFGLVDVPDFEPRYNIAPTQDAPVVRVARDGQRELVAMRWGLVPFWADGLSVGAKMINARSETASERPAFREAMRQRRCLVPADGFYEWRKQPGGKQPFWIHHASEHIMGFAGLWERWKDPEGGVVTSFTILTNPANDYVRMLHDRMPAVVRSEDYERWLAGGPLESHALARILKPLDDGDLDAIPVSTRVNRHENDDPSLLEPDGPALMRF